MAKHRRGRVRKIGERRDVENGPNKPDTDTDTE